MLVQLEQGNKMLNLYQFHRQVTSPVGAGTGLVDFLLQVSTSHLGSCRLENEKGDKGSPNFVKESISQLSPSMDFWDGYKATLKCTFSFLTKYNTATFYQLCHLASHNKTLHYNFLFIFLQWKWWDTTNILLDKVYNNVCAWWERARLLEACLVISGTFF